MDGYSTYTGNPAGGSNTSPKPGAGNPSIIIPADGYVPTSAMFQQFEQTLADFAAYNAQTAIQLVDGYSQKVLIADGIGGKSPSTYGGLAGSGDGYILNNLTVGQNLTTEGFTTLNAGAIVFGGLTTNSIITTEAVGTGPTSGHIYKAMQPVAWGWVVSGSSPTYRVQEGCSGNPTYTTTGTYQITLNTATSANSYIVTATVQSTGANPGATFCTVRYQSTTTFTVFIQNTSSLIDNDFNFVVHGIF